MQIKNDTHIKAKNLLQRDDCLTRKTRKDIDEAPTAGGGGGAPLIPKDNAPISPNP